MLHLSAIQCKWPQLPLLGLEERRIPIGKRHFPIQTTQNPVNSFEALSAEDQLSLIWKLLSLRSTSEAEGELGAIAKVKTAIME